MIWTTFWRPISLTLSISLSAMYNQLFVNLSAFTEDKKCRLTFYDGHEINAWSPLYIQSSITRKRYTFWIPYALDSFQLLYIRFFILQKSDPQGVVSGRDITRDGVVCDTCECHGIIWISCKIEWQAAIVEHPRDDCIQLFSCSHNKWRIQHITSPLLRFTWTQRNGTWECRQAYGPSMKAFTVNSACSITFFISFKWWGLTTEHILISAPIYHKRWA